MSTVIAPNLNQYYLKTALKEAGQGATLKVASEKKENG